YGFENMNVYRAEAFASPANTPSIKILERLGMKCEGVMRGHYLSRGVYEDSACYAILKEEYVSLKQGEHE
ncbi:MAG: GNAT family N-acetyltransferase, partial [Taibaiella sp.]|nr:GNAT family N-acetyltransferase [Taibaiella sp.]